MTTNLKKRAVTSGQWTVFGHVASQLFRLVSNLILTRLLVPEMFGVMAIATVFMTGLAMFSDVGLKQNVIQSPRGEEKVYLNTAWTIQIIRGFVLFMIILMVSYSLVYFKDTGLITGNSVYAAEELPLLLALLSITTIIAGFNSMNYTLLSRRLMLKKMVMIELVSQVAGTVVMVSFAWFYREIWVLALSGIVMTLVKMILSHHSSLGKRDRVSWDKECANEIIHFGKWIFISSILGFLLAQGDRLLLGLWVSPEVLGVYSIAFFLAMALKEALKKLVNSVFFPMLSEIVRTRPGDLKHVYYKIRLKVDFIAMALAGLLANLGHIIVDVLYDERYVEAGWMFEVLSFSIVFVGYSMAGMCLMAKGDSKSNMLLTLIAMLFLYVSLPVAYHYYGIFGAIVMIAFNYIIDIPSTFFMMKKAGLLDLKKEVMMIPVFFIAYVVGDFMSSLVI